MRRALVWSRWGIEATGDVALFGDPDRPLSERLAAIGQAGLGKLRAERDLTRLIFRDLDHFPDLLAEVLAGDVQPTYAALAAWLQASASDPNRDWEAIAAVLGGAIANYWTVTHFLGEPSGTISEDRFLAAWVAVASSVLAADIRA